MNPWRRRPAAPPAPEEVISLEDIAWRIGASEVRPAHYDEEEAAALAAAATEGIGAEHPAAGASGGPSGADAAPPATSSPVLQPRPLARPAHTVRRNIRASAASTRAHQDGGPRRLALWRDVSALLFGVVAIALIAQLALSRSGQTAIADPTPGRTAAPSDVAVIATDRPVPTLGPTIGPVIDPSLIPVIEATPTPVPVTPAPTPAPTPRITPRPVTTPRPTPTPKPTPPPLTAKISATCVAPFQVRFSASGSTSATSYSWAFDDGTTSGLVTVPHTYAVARTYTVVLTVTGSGGPLSATKQVTIPCA